jgi:hypothetical protein
MSINAIKSIDGQLANSETLPGNKAKPAITYAIAAALRVSKKDNFFP